jgi:predicted amidohydrolase
MVSQTVSGGTNFQTAMLNAMTIVNISTEYQNQVDLLVFPEYELYGGFGLDSQCEKSGKQVMSGFCEPIPVAGTAVSCSGSSLSTSMLSNIACPFVNSTLTISYNACEKGSSGDNVWYNTQVVVQGGVVLAKYRKFHVWATKCFETPSLELVTFTIGANYTFGIFTCFDILFADPKNDLVAMGVKYFSYSSAIPLIARDAVKLFSWENSVNVVNSNLQLGETSVISNGTLISQCNSNTNCVAIATFA